MDYRQTAAQMAQKYGIDPNLFAALITQESGWRPNVTSPKGAYGLTQVMPDTARDPGFGITPLTNVEDPTDQLRFGAEYLSTMLNRYNGDVPRALAAYNWGAGNADKWSGDPNSLPEETRNYIASITGGGSITKSSKGGGEGPGMGVYDDLFDVQTLDGSPLPPEIVAQRAEWGIRKAESDALGFGAFTEPSMPPGFGDFGGGSGPVHASTRGALNEDDMTEKEKGFLAWLMPDMTKEQRQDRLLAIGAGLLSGTNWNDGFAGAANNLMGLRGEEREGERREEDRGFDWLMQERRLGAAAEARKAGGGGYQRVGSAMDPTTGEIIGGVAFDPNTGMYGQVQADGSFKAMPGVVPLNNSTAAGDKLVTGNMVAKAQAEVQELQTGMRTIERILPTIQSMDYGVDGFVEDLKINLKTLSGTVGLSEEEILRRAAQGDIQGLIGQARTEVVGPGVMTEADALRVLSALGGDAQGIFSNPQVATELLTTRYEGMARRYGQMHDQYDMYRNIPGAGFIDIPRHTPNADFTSITKGKTDKGALSSEVPEGVDPALWEVMTPEQRKLWE
ncbi:lytic transglycosylase domain-containing protein [Xinfangfangia sp. CPCC 101601]|uniref:Lytic transglycosylase domain-containing protein n=1 Tax=Pseudogemmobacter lacusdianii TaxID=3069608 RepID=A0ABU0VYB0_9RHOB|nr:lytic transglycosylase domain-containing protein [Xinfangfangia sp. CPCC 101601]MDQ2066747.1 lytic transglycosylase domain-containing protein [Xinfangfangia sp. CPCC 101601]